MRTNPLESLTDNIVIDKNKCTSCGICVETCILDNLRLNLAPCRQACPLGVNCQGYIQLIAREDDLKGMELLRETLPFPEILSRICSQPCEDNCYRKKMEGEAVAIRALKRYLSDNSGEETISLPEISPDSGKRTAIIGSGPSGLLAAHDLRRNGHGVTIFDAEGEPGGMLRWAIPEFKLPQDIVEKEIDLLRKMGVVFECGVSVGKNKSLEELKSDFHAILVATGCPEHTKLGLEGENLPGVYHGLPFLREVRVGQQPNVGQNVVVIGGGNVAVDAAQTSRRLGAENVTMVCLEAREDMQAFFWALETALSEGIKLECGWGPLEFSSSQGTLKGVDFQRCIQVFNETGDFEPLFESKEQMSLGAETIIVAIGQSRDLSILESAGLVKENEFQIDPLTLQTVDEMIFVAGDVLSGPSSVIEAMAEGRRAAESVDRFLKGEHLSYGRNYEGPIETDFEIDTSDGKNISRASIPIVPFKGKGDFNELEQCLGSEAAREEARRCYSCGQPFGKYRTCWFCLPCEVDCPHEALWVEIPYLLR